MMNWQQYFKPWILERGYDYYEMGNVDIISHKDTVIEANVDGSQVYRVHIDMNDIQQMTCTCPHFEDGNYCKHLAAVLYAVDATAPLPYDEEDEYDDEDEDGNYDHNPYYDYGDEIEEVIEKCNKQELKEILKLALQSQSKAVDVLLEKRKKYPPKFSNELDRIYFMYSDRYGNIKATEERNFLLELDKYFMDIIMPMFIRNQNKRGFKETTQFYERLRASRLDSWEVFDDLVYKSCQGVWKTILEVTKNNALKEEMFTWFDNQVKKSKRENTPNEIKEVYITCFNEPEFIERKKATLDNKVAFHVRNEYGYDKRVLDWLIPRLDMESEPFNYIKRYIENRYVKEYTINYLLEKNDMESAISLLKDLMKKHQNQLGILHDEGALLLNVYEKYGMKEDYKQELWKMLTEYHKGDLDVFIKFKKLCTADEWKEKRELIFNCMKETYSNIERFYIEEELFDRLLKLVQNNFYSFQQYEDYLGVRFPKETIAIYKKEIVAIASRSNNRKQYHYVCVLLKKMAKYPGGREIALELKQSLYSLNTHRHAFIDELNQLKF